MKNLKLILPLLALILLVPSCENDGGDSKLNLEVAAVPNVTKVTSETAASFIDLVAIGNNETVTISFTIDKAQGDVESMDVVLFYIKADAAYKAVLEAGVTEFPKTYTLTQADLINAFDELNAAEDFELGDQLIVTTDITLRDGRVINIFNSDGTPAIGVDVENSPLFESYQAYNVSCPSDLGGTYTVSTTATSTDSGPTPDENPITNFPYQVTLTDNGGGNYTISDAFGGVYMLWYDIYGLDFEVEGEFSDVCGTISGVFPEPFGTNVTYTGAVDPDTGVITIHWINGYDDEGTSVLTPN